MRCRTLQRFMEFYKLLDIGQYMSKNSKRKEKTFPYHASGYSPTCETGVLGDSGAGMWVGSLLFFQMKPSRMNDA